MLSTVYLVAEDELGLALGRKLVAEASPLTVYCEENGYGYGTLKNKTPNYQQMGVFMPVLMLTDLDSCACPSLLIQNWLGAAPSKGFLFRVCVREVEAWLLAHRQAMADFLKISLTKLPQQPERLADPKKKLITLAQNSPRNIREGLTPVGRATIGPRYNALLAEFVECNWSPDAAANNSQSLKRARLRLQQLAMQVTL